ncbi:hypothetical protein H9Q10_11510 [Eikenella sp. S3360]|uniref:Uncharacterized protein n=1 Tax=Eikenella glucosivorans TaxID=2766967 RepID=A0ABS0NDE5_9NEIS|nr:hypothetical protein [Eikenella glucosivorans]MBH5330289.1 hypothetical protein [Eikenella glucosivorans]
MHHKVKAVTIILGLAIALQSNANPKAQDVITDIYANMQWSCMQKRMYAMEYLGNLTDEESAQNLLDYIDEKNEACTHPVPNHAATITNNPSPTSYNAPSHQTTSHPSRMLPSQHNSIARNSSSRSQASSAPYATNSTRYRSHSSEPKYYGSSCDCRDHRICIGPRGGRYCITSGGHKRYNPF